MTARLVVLVILWLCSALGHSVPVPSRQSSRPTDDVLAGEDFLSLVLTYGENSPPVRNSASNVAELIAPDNSRFFGSKLFPRKKNHQNLDMRNEKFESNPYRSHGSRAHDAGTASGFNQNEESSPQFTQVYFTSQTKQVPLITNSNLSDSKDSFKLQLHVTETSTDSSASTESQRVTVPLDSSSKTVGRIPEIHLRSDSNANTNNDSNSSFKSDSNSNFSSNNSNSFTDTLQVVSVRVSSSVTKQLPEVSVDSDPHREKPKEDSNQIPQAQRIEVQEEPTLTALQRSSLSIEESDELIKLGNQHELLKIGNDPKFPVNLKNERKTSFSSTRQDSTSSKLTSSKDTNLPALSLSFDSVGQPPRSVDNGRSFNLEFSKIQNQPSLSSSINSFQSKESNMKLSSDQKQVASSFQPVVSKEFSKAKLVEASAETNNIQVSLSANSTEIAQNDNLKPNSFVSNQKPFTGQEKQQGAIKHDDGYDSYEGSQDTSPNAAAQYYYDEDKQYEDFQKSSKSLFRPPNEPPVLESLPKVYGEPAKVYGEPAKVYGEPAKVYGEPAKVYGEPAKVYGEPAKVYGEPARVYGVPAKVYSEPAKVYSEPARFYGETPTALSETASDKKKLKDVLKTGGDPPAFGNGETEKRVDDGQAGNILEGKNYKKYRVEEKTADGFIVGEYGVVSHDGGSLRGVRYTADSDINPSLIYDALVKFLALK